MRSLERQWLANVLAGCTFDDFLIKPGWGTAKSRKDISLVSNFSKNIKLNLPIVSANMDTITGARMAVAVAKEGGLGIIHRYLSIEDQCLKVKEVKREENFIIENPYSISPKSTIGEARNIMDKNKVGGLVVVDQNGRLVGMLTSRDVRYCPDDTVVENRMTAGENLITAKLSEISRNLARNLMDANRIEKLPLVDDNFTLRGLIASVDIDNLEKFPLANKDENGQLMVGAAVGATGDYIERSSELIKSGVDVIVMDIANFQSDVGKHAAEAFLNTFSGNKVDLVVGNIVLPMAAKLYQEMGVAGVKIGLGPGSACTTRFNTNVGVTQAEAVYSCSVVSDIPVCADGGIKRDGHIGLALILGGDSVMLGGMLAGTDETPGLVFRNSRGNKVKSFRGMASREAMYERLRAEEADDPYETTSRLSPEGIEKQVEYRGSAVPILRDIAGHLASMVSYMGSMNLEDAKRIFMTAPSYFLKKLSESSKKESWDR